MKTRGKDYNASAEVADRLLTIKEVSELTGLKIGTLYHFVAAQRIPVVRISNRCLRFRRSSLERWFEQLTRHAENTD